MRQPLERSEIPCCLPIFFYQSHDDFRMISGKSGRFYLLAALGGFVYGVLFRVFLPGFVDPAIINPELRRLPAPVSMPMELLLLAVNWPWSLLSCAIMFALLLYLGSRKNVWFLASAIGALLGSLAAQAVSHLGSTNSSRGAGRPPLYVDRFGFWANVVSDSHLRE